jgi:hypothetical protein
VARKITNGVLSAPGLQVIGWELQQLPVLPPNDEPPDELIDFDRKLTALLAKPAGWDDHLRAVVSSGFTRRSWDPETAVRGIDEVIEEIESLPASPVLVTAEHGWQHSKLGVVTTTCTWDGLGDAYEVRVVRVYTRYSGQWRCEYWQETRGQRPAE